MLNMFSYANQALPFVDAACVPGLLSGDALVLGWSPGRPPPGPKKARWLRLLQSDRVPQAARHSLLNGYRLVRPDSLPARDGWEAGSTDDWPAS